MPHAKSVHAVFVVPVVWLHWSPEPKTANFFVCPHKRTFNTAVIQPYPWSIARMAVLNKYVFLLVVHCHQIRVHRRTVWLSSRPWGARQTCEVAITGKITPTWLTYICLLKKEKKRKEKLFLNSFGSFYPMVPHLESELPWLAILNQIFKK